MVPESIFHLEGDSLARAAKAAPDMLPAAAYQLQLLTIPDGEYCRCKKCRKGEG